MIMLNSIAQKEEKELKEEYNFIKSQLEPLKKINRTFSVQLHYAPNKSLTLTHSTGLKILSFIPARPFHLDSGVDLKISLHQLDKIDICLYDSKLIVESKVFADKQKNKELSDMIENYIIKNKLFISSLSFKKNIDKLTKILFKNDFLLKNGGIDFDFKDTKSSYELISLNYDIISPEYKKKKYIQK